MPFSMNECISNTAEWLKNKQVPSLNKDQKALYKEYYIDWSWYIEIHSSLTKLVHRLRRKCFSSRMENFPPIPSLRSSFVLRKGLSMAKFPSILAKRVHYCILPREQLPVSRYACCFRAFSLSIHFISFH